MATSKSLPPSLLLPSDPAYPLDKTAKRVEIDEFIADNVMTNIFLLAIQRMQQIKIKKKDDPDEDWFSWYDLAAIHGFPFELWRNVPNNDFQNPLPERGGYYCTHGSTVFPTWHRLYIHMFEQTVWRTMSRIADEFSSDSLKKTHTEALKRFRLPYWDPCLPRRKLSKPNEVKKPKDYIGNMFDMPVILKMQSVHVVQTDGKHAQIRNPLLKFDFPSPEDYERTGRAKIDWTGQEGTKPGDTPAIAEIEAPGNVTTTRTPGLVGNPNDDLFTWVSRQSYYTLSTTFFQLLHPSRYEGTQRWNQFANHWHNGKDKAEQRWPENTSLESWHDNIHDICGTGVSAGHMAVVPVAAFDPIFWLHHNNIDRMFALWQAMYEHKPDTFVAEESTPPNPDGLNANTGLAPFARIQNEGELKCYTSNDVKDWTVLGYAVPGDKKLDQKGRDKVAEYIMSVYEWSTDKKERPKDTLGYPRDVNGVYAISGKNFESSSPKPVEFLGLEKHSIVKEVFSAHGEKIRDTTVDVSFKNDLDNKTVYPAGSLVSQDQGQMRTWSILMNVQKYAFNSTFKVNFYLGEKPSGFAFGAFGQFVNPSRIGFSSIFAFQPEAGCSNCTSNRDMTYGDVIPITNKLRDCLESSENPPGTWPPAELRTLDSLEPRHVVKFLTKNLSWDITTPSGEVKSEEDMKAAKLELVVADSLYEYPIESNNVSPLGAYGPYTEHPEVTIGKAGGYPEALRQGGS